MKLLSRLRALSALSFFLSLAFYLTPVTAAGQSCNCSSGVNLTGTTISLSGLISATTLPAGTYSGCLYVPANATLEIDVSYTFSAATLIMDANATIKILTNRRLTIDNGTVLQGCGALWKGIVLEPETITVFPGSELDMEDSYLQDAEYGIFAQNQAKIRLVDNAFTNNYVSLRVRDYVPFINFGNAGDFSGNVFTVNGSYVGSTAAWTAIWFDRANTFFIGLDFTNPPTVVNTIKDSRYGVRVDSSTGIGLYGLDIADLNGSISASPDLSERVGVRIECSFNVNVKYSKLYTTSDSTRLYYGIVTLNAGSKQVYHENVINALLHGIWMYDLPYAKTMVDIEQNTISARSNCIDIEQFAAGSNNSLIINHNTVTTRSAGIKISYIDAPYFIQQNDVFTTEVALTGIWIGYCQGTGDVWNNQVVHTTNVLSDAASGLLTAFTRNCKIYDNSVSAVGFYPSTHYSSGIIGSACTNVIYCCNSVDNTNYGTTFNFTNSAIRFYTTTYGVHDTALHFTPMATFSPQFNTGNDWAGATTAIDARYSGSLFAALGNAPFKTNPANINSTKISPSGWFLLMGSDPACYDSGFTCDTMYLNEARGELRGEDLAALEPVNSAEEAVQRFEQQRLLYRLLKDNPDLQTWSTEVAEFYAAAQENAVGAFYEIDQAARAYFRLSTEAETEYLELADAVNEAAQALDGVYAAYAGASTPEQAALEVEAGELAAGINDLLPGLIVAGEQHNADYAAGLTALLAQNEALPETEAYLENEKNINTLFFQYTGGALQTLSEPEADFINELAEACPQYAGAGVYKARYLRQVMLDVRKYYPDNDCVVSAERAQAPTVSGLAIQPNPSAGKITIDLEGRGGLLTVVDVTGHIISSRQFEPDIQAIVLDLSAYPTGTYFIKLQRSSEAPIYSRLLIQR